ncbi:MAG: hypothetical protein U0793_23395 [Gemmataceae bacterium]
MPATTLPGAVERCLLSLRRRILLGRALRGSGLLLGAGSLLIAASFGLDRWLGFGTPELRLAFAALAAVVVLAGVFGLFLPLLRKPRLDTCAALLEKHYPDLTERFTSLVHLQHENRETTPLLDTFAEQASTAAGHVDTRAAFSLRRAGWIAGSGVALLALLLAPIPFSETYEAFLGRFFGSFAAPWHGFEMRVTPGDHAFLQGRPVEITASAEAFHPSARMPAECWLVTADDSGKEARALMSRGGDRFIQHARDLTRPLTYWVEAGGVASERFELRPVAPIHIAEGSLQAEVAPPPYLKDVPAKYAGSAKLEAIQYGALTWRLTLNRPAQTVAVVWTDADGKPARFAAERLEVEGVSIRGSMGLPEPGTFAGLLELTAEHGFTFKQPLPTLEVRADGAPRVALISSRGASADPAASSVPPGDRIRFRIEADDDLGLQSMHWEYRLADGPVRRTPPVDLGGKTTLSDEIEFAVPEKAKIGAELTVRLCVEDVRFVKKGALTAGEPGGVRSESPCPATDVVANRTYAPGGKEGWLTFKVEKVDPSRKRAVLARRDEAEQKLLGLIKKVSELHGEIGKLRAGSHHEPRLRPEQQKRLADLLAKDRDLQIEMLLTAEKMESWLGPVAEGLEDVAAKEMKHSEESLARAEKAASETRDAEFQKSEEQLLQAVKKLQAMFKLNESLADQRLARLEAGDLARAEDNLADETAKGRKKEDVQEAQERIRKKLEALSGNAGVEEMLKDLTKKKIEESANDLESLAKEMRDGKDDPGLDKEARSLLDGLIRLQSDLAKRIDAWQKDETPRIDQARQAAEAMRGAEWRQAVTRQEQAEEKLGLRALDIESGKDLRSTGLHIAKTQEAIYKELFRLGEDLPRLSEAEQRDNLEKIGKAQRDLSEAIAALKIPEKHAAARAAQARALAMAQEIVDRYQKKDVLGAFLKMEEAQPELDALAGILPQDERPDGEKREIAAAERDKAKAARGFQEEQRDLRLKLQKLLAEASSKNAAAAAEKAKAGADKADKLGAELMKLAQDAKSAEAKAKMGKAGALAEEASKSLKGMEKAAKEGKAADAKEAALKLEIAAKTARAATEEPAKMGKEPPRDPELAKGLEASKRAMDEAKMDLAKGDRAAAVKSMSRAADALKRASTEPKGKRGTAMSKLPGKSPAAKGESPRGSPAIPDRAWEEFLGKSWGELPGETKAQLLFELQDRFGEYQPLIQRYFRNLSRDEKR